MTVRKRSEGKSLCSFLNHRFFRLWIETDQISDYIRNLLWSKRAFIAPRGHGEGWAGACWCGTMFDKKIKVGGKDSFIRVLQSRVNRVQRRDSSFR